MSSKLYSVILGVSNEGICAAAVWNNVSLSSRCEVAFFCAEHLEEQARDNSLHVSPRKILFRLR